MLHKRKYKNLIVVILIFLPLSSFAFLGFGGAASNMMLIPYLQQQVTALRSQLRTANQALGYARAAQRGFNRIRRYGMNDAKNDFLLMNSDYDVIKKELYTAKEGGDYTDIRFQDLDKKIRQIYKPHKEKPVPGTRRSIFASNIAHKNMKTSMLMRDKTSKQAFKDGRNISNASKNSQSPAESQRITADGVGLLVQTQADQMVLLSNMNLNSSVDLQIQANKEKEAIEGSVVDQQALSASFKNMKAIR